MFVVDNNDRDQVVEVRNELHRMLNEVSYYLVKPISMYNIHSHQTRTDVQASQEARSIG